MDIIKVFERGLKMLEEVKQETERRMQHNREVHDSIETEFAQLQRYHEKAVRILEL